MHACARGQFPPAVKLTIIVFGSALMANGNTQQERILSSPVNNRVTSGQTAYFNCHALGMYVQWFINETYALPRRDYEKKGFNFTDVLLTPRATDQLHEENNTIVVDGHPAINNTLITCRAGGTQHGQYTEADATLIIIGPPLCPPFHITQKWLTDNFILHNINWSEPFTWSGFPITGYEINVHNYLSNDVTTITKSNESFTHLFLSDGSECYQLDFAVFAYNSVGRSEANVFSSGHPLAPNMMQFVEANITFLSSGETHLSTYFLVPKVCLRYQTATISIEIYTENMQSIVENLGSEQFTQNESTLVQKTIEANLTLNRVYHIVIYFTSVGVTVSASSIFNTYFKHALGTVMENSTAAGAIGLGPKSIQTSTIAGVTSGGVILCLLLFTACIGTYCVCRKSVKNRRQPTESDVDASNTLQQHQERNTRKNRPPNLRMHASNPIYEGAAIYETMPGDTSTCEFLLSTSSSLSTPSTPQVDLNTRYTFDISTNLVPNLPLPRKASVSKPLVLKTVKVGDTSMNHDIVEIPPSDEYMVMDSQSCLSSGSCA